MAKKPEEKRLERHVGVPPTAYREPCASCQDIACRLANGVNAGGPCCFYIGEAAGNVRTPDPEDHGHV